MRQDFTMYIYKKDSRFKSGMRLFSTTVWQGRDEAGMEREVRGLYRLYPKSMFHFEYVPVKKTVRNLMTGKEVEIDYDTPRCCDPSSELYWSM
jgi:hypothetical protein